MSSRLEEFGNRILEIKGHPREQLREAPLEFSELLLLMDDFGDYAIEFDVLGQNFLHNSKGIYTFDELGYLLEPGGDFLDQLEEYLDWRLEVLRSFSL